MQGAFKAAVRLILSLLLVVAVVGSSGAQGARPRPPHGGHFLRPHPSPLHPPVLPPNQIIQFNQGYSEPLLSPPAPVFLPPPPSLQGSPVSPPPAVSEPPSLSQGMAITVRKNLHEGSDNGGVKPSPLIERPKEAAEHLADCWSPPIPPRDATVEVTIRFAFDGQGGVIGAPRITYVKAVGGVSGDAVRASILTAVKDCTPMRFTDSMAASAGGYPLAIRFIGQREEEKDRD